MNEVMDTLLRAAKTPAAILILGESGTGKSVVARALHQRSYLANKPFITVTCPSLSKELLESELFGHVRGSFTGAIKDKPGRLEAAEGGTVLLDEIGDLTPVVQSKLLRFLQERTFERVGGAQTIKVNARIIAATNQHLEQLVKEKRFREDLYYRLNVIELPVPALRDRPGEILKLAEYFAAQAAQTHHKPAHSIAPEAREALVSYSWPGNIRELRNVMERAVILSRGETIDLSDLPDKILASPDKLDHSLTLEQMERRHIEVVLEQAMTLEEAAEMLGINVATLWRKRQRYGLD
jgi:NtrC-family two-component system response regulator AlgB